MHLPKINYSNTKYKYFWPWNLISMILTCAQSSMFYCDQMLRTTLYFSFPSFISGQNLRSLNSQIRYSLFSFSLDVFNDYKKYLISVP